ncbi:universal stress protein [Halomonas daqiaonensis]|uniref:Nucleotide-binding universal stress protein, UspA family n=1 Tax=Halomonas daqiaonensis TaxID=650850 RepID=A0A1H7WFM9_9GAMM|nr:universal stress protein [Halomonas daqiaonensis]SEM19869.1 Nucleotide-binding universal stress protein, UspA family [Halomonas daqiaonensis]
MTSVVASEERVEPRRTALQTRLADQQAGDVNVDMAIHESAKEHLSHLAGHEEVGLCMMAHGRRPVPEMLVGSVTAGVVRRANQPVYLCGPRFDAQAHRKVEVLMVCVDGSKLSAAILPHVVALSKRLDARLQLLQVIDTSATSAVPLDGGHADVMESGYVHGVARRLRADHGMEVDWEVLHGDLADSIVSNLADCQNTMLAMTTHGRSGFSQVVAGSVSHEIIDDDRVVDGLHRAFEQAQPHALGLDLVQQQTVAHPHGRRDREKFLQGKNGSFRVLDLQQPVPMHGPGDSGAATSATAPSTPLSTAPAAATVPATSGDRDLPPWPWP